MKILLATFVIIFSTTLYASECTMSEDMDEFESPIAYMDEVLDDENFDSAEIQALNEQFDKYNLFNEQLDKYLLENTDINIQLIGLMSLSYDDKKPATKEILNNAIDISSDKSTIYYADIACHQSESIADWCHAQGIHDIHQKIDPENIFTYVLMMHDSDDINSLQESLLASYDNSTYSHSYYYEHILKLIHTIEKFNQNNVDLYADSFGTNSEAFSEGIKAQHNQILKLQLIEKGLVPVDYQDNILKTQNLMLATGKMMTISNPMSNMIRACETQENTFACEHISELLKADKSIINNIMGESINVKLNIEDISSQEQLPSNVNAVYEKIQCYMSSDEVLYAQQFNYDYALDFIKMSQQFGEIEAMKKISNQIHNTIKQNGFNPSFNPADCQ